jgi:hypothetical protein
MTNRGQDRGRHTAHVLTMLTMPPSSPHFVMVSLSGEWAQRLAIEVRLQADESMVTAAGLSWFKSRGTASGTYGDSARSTRRRARD